MTTYRGKTCYLRLQGGKIGHTGWDEGSLNCCFVTCNVSVTESFHICIEEIISKREKVQEIVQ